jgi:hypothetical protein
MRSGLFLKSRSTIDGNLLAHLIMIVRVVFLVDLISISMTQPQHPGAKVAYVLLTGKIGIAVGMATHT